MKQSKLMSLIEVVVGTIVGLIIAMIAQTVFFHAYNVPISLSVNIQLVIWMTVISVLRGYVIRRLFENGIAQTVVNMWYSMRNRFAKPIEGELLSGIKPPRHYNCRCSVDLTRNDKNLPKM